MREEFQAARIVQSHGCVNTGAVNDSRLTVLLLVQRRTNDKTKKKRKRLKWEHHCCISIVKIKEYKTVPRVKLPQSSVKRLGCYGSASSLEGERLSERTWITSTWICAIPELPTRLTPGEGISCPCRSSSRLSERALRPNILVSREQSLWVCGTIWATKSFQLRILNWEPLLQRTSRVARRTRTN